MSRRRNNNRLLPRILNSRLFIDIQVKVLHHVGRKQVRDLHVIKRNGRLEESLYHQRKIQTIPESVLYRDRWR